MSATAAIHAGLRQLGIEQDDARDLYERVTGKRSLREMNDRERQGIVQALRQRGFKPASKGLQGRFAKKLQALWIAGWNLGVIRHREDEHLITFVKGRTGVDHVRFLHDAADARKAIEALKGMLARDGGVDWRDRPDHDFLRHDSGRIAWAQYRILVPGATLVGNEAGFRREVMATAGCKNHDLHIGLLDDADWRRVMNTLGKRVRKVRT